MIGLHLVSSVTATLKLDLKSLSHHIDFLAEKDGTMGSLSFPVFHLQDTKYFHWLLKIKRFFIDLRTLFGSPLLSLKPELESENADSHRTLHQRVTLWLLLFSSRELLKTPDSIPTSTFFLSGLLLSLCFPRAS